MYAGEPHYRPRSRLVDVSSCHEWCHASLMAWAAGWAHRFRVRCPVADRCCQPRIRSVGTIRLIDRVRTWLRPQTSSRTPTQAEDLLRSLWKKTARAGSTRHIVPPPDPLGLGHPSQSGRRGPRRDPRGGRRGSHPLGRFVWTPGEVLIIDWGVKDGAARVLRGAGVVAVRAGLIDEYAIVTHPVLVGGGTPFFTALATG